MLFSRNNAEGIDDADVEGSEASEIREPEPTRLTRL